MQIELKRAFTPDEIGAETPCGICGVEFITGAVLAHVLVHDVEVVCPECVEYLGQRSPEAFPTIEELAAASERYAGAVYSSEEEVMRLEEAEDLSVYEAYRQSWINRAGPDR